MTCTPSARPRSRSAVSSSGSRRQGPTAWRTYPTSGRSRKSRGCIAEPDLALARTQEEGAASGCGDDEDDVQRRIWPARRHDDFREGPLLDAEQPHGVEALDRLAAGGHAQLAVHGDGLGLDRVARHVEPLADLGERQVG